MPCMNNVAGSIIKTEIAANSAMGHYWGGVNLECGYNRPVFINNVVAVYKSFIGSYRLNGASNRGKKAS